MALDALYHLRDIGTGDTRPQVFLCGAGDALGLWVLKLAGLSAGELAADWIGSALAERTGLRCPPAAIAQVSPGALSTVPAAVRAWAQPGPAFASRLAENAQAGLTDTDLLTAPPDDLGMMYALDAWLEVLDRRKPDGVWNLLKNPSDGTLVVLDYGKSLSPCLQVVLGGGDELIAPDYPLAVRRTASVSAALRMCERIEAITPVEIERIIADMPEQWLSAAVRPRVVQFLTERAGRIRDLCLDSLEGKAR